MWSYLKIPKVQLFITLLLIYLSSFLVNHSLNNIKLLVFGVGFTVFFDLLFTYIRKRTLFLPLASFVTGLIITLIFDPNSFWYEVALASALAMAVKNFLRFSNHHIFNPAGIGVFLASIIFKKSVAWWGASFQTLNQFHPLNIFLFLILLLPVLVSAYRMRRSVTILTFLVNYTLISLIINSFSKEVILASFFDPTIVFFSLVMLPEPITSPSRLRYQLLFGLVVALLSQILAFGSVSSYLSSRSLLPDTLIPALLVANLIFFRFK